MRTPRGIVHTARSKMEGSRCGFLLMFRFPLIRKGLEAVSSALMACDDLSLCSHCWPPTPQARWCPSRHDRSQSLRTSFPVGPTRLFSSNEHSVLPTSTTRRHPQQRRTNFWFSRVAHLPTCHRGMQSTSWQFREESPSPCAHDLIESRSDEELLRRVSVARVPAGAAIQLCNGRDRDGKDDV